MKFNPFNGVEEIGYLASTPNRFASLGVIHIYYSITFRL
jgi:hypothetical protein